MRYDFDTVTDRRNTGSLKWDVADGELPMWVADMDFKTAPEIVEALAERTAHGIFGYGIIPDEWYASYIGWWHTRHHFQMEREWLIFCTGVVPAISSIVRKMTTIAENVLVLTPVYNIFFNSIVNNGRHILECPLQYDGGVYSIDFAALEDKLALPQSTMLLLCNPHNPVGKIWDRETLQRIGELCAQYNVLVVSDEIHCDITMPDKGYTPFASVSEECRMNSITCIAPTKAFNIAGLQTAAVVVPNPALRCKVSRGLNTDEVAEPNAFAITAAVAAFEKGGNWLKELNRYIAANKQMAETYVTANLPMLFVVPSEATYLLWVDCHKVCGDTGRLAEHIRKTTGLYVSEGAQYGNAGKGFLRINVAAPKSIIQEGLVRLKAGVESFGFG